ncbi:hypothetical protein ACJX0J_024928, partial [Zea mays]
YSVMQLELFYNHSEAYQHENFANPSLLRLFDEMTVSDYERNSNQIAFMCSFRAIATSFFMGNLQYKYCSQSNGHEIFCRHSNYELLLNEFGFVLAQEQDDFPLFSKVLHHLLSLGKIVSSLALNSFKSEGYTTLYIDKFYIASTQNSLGLMHTYFSLLILKWADYDSKSKFLENIAKLVLPFWTPIYLVMHFLSSLQIK